MENCTAQSGLTAGSVGEKAVQPSSNLWRPWAQNDMRMRAISKTPKVKTVGVLADDKHPKSPQITHPVKLYWPKSRCFDYLYQDAEMLLLNYPVQAAICIYEDSSSDGDDSDDEEDDDNEKELN